MVFQKSGKKSKKVAFYFEDEQIDTAPEEPMNLAVKIISSENFSRQFMLYSKFVDI